MCNIYGLKILQKGGVVDMMFFFWCEPDCKKRFKNIMRFARFLPGKLVKLSTSHFAIIHDVNLIKIFIFNCVGKEKRCRHLLTTDFLNVLFLYL